MLDLQKALRALNCHPSRGLHPPYNNPHPASEVRDMKKTAFLLLTPLLGTTLLAQDITGNWQGTLQPPQGPALRLILKISLDNDKLKALAYSIDRNPQPLPATAITRDGAVVKISFSAIAGGYEGKLTADGNSIAGTWRQDSLSAPLRLTRATPETAWAIPELSPPPKNMRTDVEPGIEVATVKPSRPDEGFGLGAGRGGANVFSTTGTTVRTLIQFANGVHPRQITVPEWIDSEALRRHHQSRSGGCSQHPAGEGADAKTAGRPLQNRIPPGKEGALPLRPHPLPKEV